MKKIYYLVTALALVSTTSCGDGFNFPEVGAETDLYSRPLKYPFPANSQYING